MAKTLEDIGIYTNIHESGNIAPDRHKMYYATCKICGMVVEKRLAEIKKSNTICRHKILNKKSDIYKVNDMPKGWASQSKLNIRIYYLWKAMIVRTTDEFWKQYPSYTGTTVDDRWRVLSNFVNDIKDIDGYSDWCVAKKHQMMLDKDTKIKGNKHYSKDTCKFITSAESNRDVSIRHPENLQKAREAYKIKHSIPVRFVNIKTNETIDFSSLKEGCRILNLNFRNAWSVLSEQYPDRYTIKGWKIYKL